MKNILLGLLGLIIILGVAYFITRDTAPESASDLPTTAPTGGVAGTGEPLPDSVADTDMPPVPETPVTPEAEPMSVLGQSVDGRDITAYHYGEGDTELLFVGGIHGGYSWNTALVAYELMDYLDENPDIIPENVKVTVIPVLNPDGLMSVTGKEGPFAASDVPASANTVAGRFNANNVDLNRNFDCAWQATGVWQSRSVSGGSAPFSEPESKAFKAYIDAHEPAAVVVWYSAAGGVFSSNCYNGVLPETTALTNLYAQASGYKAYKEFNFYDITGDMVNWLAREGIPAISVLLTNHTDTDWTKNKAGIDAMLAQYK